MNNTNNNNNECIATTTISNSSIIEKNEYEKNCFVTPKKAILNALISSDIKQFQQRSPANRGDLQSINLNLSSGPLHILKDRYLLTNFTQSSSSTTLTNLKCTDIYTEDHFNCKLINENFEKVALAYFQLKSYNKYDHDLVRPIHDAVQIEKNRTYLVVPANEYGDLHSYVKVNKILSELEARRLFLQICQTVQLCHQQGIVLRDLKLRKFVFIDKDRTKLQYESLEGSFILDEPSDDTLSEKIGCPLYVAPELITSNRTFTGYAADMWSLGIMLFTMLVGRYPFSDTNGQTLFNKILHADITLPSFLSPKVKCLIRSLLRRNPEERLIAEDILYHQWFQENDLSTYLNDCSQDQFVPDLCLIADSTDIESFEMVG